MDMQKGAPERGWPRVGHFLARARRPKSARQAAAEAGASLRTVASYERAEIDYATIPPLMANYAMKIAGWTEADIQAIYDGGDPPAAREQSASAVGVPISEDTQAQALAAIYGLRDIPAWERRALAAVIESLPLAPQETTGDSQVSPSDGNGAEAG